MKAGTRLLASLSLCAVAVMLAVALETPNVTAAGGNPSADIDQCANGPLTAPVPCTGTAWQNGNANGSSAHWAEGDSIAYRVKFGSLSTGTSHQITIEWDTTKGGKHALDYLTSYNRTENVGNDPCSGVAGCSGPTVPPPTTFAIPPDTNTGLNLPPATSSPADGRWDQVFTMFGGTITSVMVADPSISNPTLPYNVTGSYSGDSSTSVTITFTAGTPTPVLAWGGHIANRKDWGMDNSAVSITGSPFHMRVLGLDGVGGNQDRGLSNSAVVYPAILTITKNVLTSDGANLTGPTPFNFTSTGPSTNSVPDVDPAFTLVNDGVTPPPDTLPANQKQFRLFSFGPQYTINETSTAGFGLNGLSCSATLNGAVQPDTITENLATATATIVAAEGQDINCTFVNQQYATLTVIKNVVKTYGGTAEASAFTVRVTGNQTNVAAPGSEAGTVYSFTPGTYTISEDAPLLSGYKQTGFSGDCDATGKVVLSLGGSKRCTITNHDIAGHLIIKKVVDNTFAGTKRATDFSFSVNGGAATTFVQDGADPLKGLNNVDVPAGSFNVVESATPIAGYTTTYVGCSGTILNDETRTCTITNTAQSGTLIVQAIVINDNGGTRQATQFSFKINTNAPSAFLQDGANVLAGKNTLTEPVGTYTITAPAVTGYSVTYNNCTNVVITSQGTETCTITFDDIPAHLVINKVVVNNNGGSLTAAAFSGTISGAVVATGGNTWSGASTDRTLTAIGNYSIAENAHPGYDATLSTDCTGTIALGETKTCTVTNDDQPSHLIIKKVVVNNNGGTLTAAAFSGTIGGAVIATGGNAWTGALTDRTLTAVGSYNVAENAHPGYDAAFSTDCAGAIGLGETKICTVTNDDQPPHLIINKVVVNNNGGSLAAANFSGTASGVTAAGGTSWTGASTNLTLTSVGSYNVSENAHPGYDATFSTDCTGSIALGETRTCTVTNDDQPPHLIIKKVVVNDDGGSLTAANFSGTIGGVVIASGGNTWTGASTDRILTAIGNYSVAENAHPGYDAIFSVDCSGSIGLGETKICTVTNNDQPAYLVINKVVVNDHGGAATAADFSGTVNGVTAVGGQTWTGASTTLRLTSVGSYSVAENAHAGYDATFSTDCTGNIALGETKTCTVTNNDQAARIVVNKVVVNDNGGSLTAAGFSGTVGGAVVASAGNTWTGASTTLTLTKIGNYNVAENAHPGYDATFSTDCTGTIALGETKTCTVTNNDQPARIVINKVVVNNNGGSLAASAFSGTVGGIVVATGGNTWTGASTTLTLTKIGSYSVAENAHPGYDATFSTDCTGTIALGETKTCTVTNDDQAATLIVKKVVQNNNGGSLSAADFSGTVGGVTVAAGAATWAGASTTLTLVTVGNYNVAENAHPGYDATFSAACSGSIALGETKTCTVTNNDQAAHLIINKVVVNNDGASATAAAFSGTIGGTVVASGGNTWAGATTDRTLTAIGSYNVAENAHPGYDATFSSDCTGTIGLGETKTCTVTNNDQPGHLIINKVVVNNNGGSLTPAAFSGTISGTLVAGNNTWAGASTSLTPTTLGSYNVTENAVAGYVATFSAECAGTLGPGETKTCTITNDDLPARLTLIKHVDNSHGGTAAASAFTLTASGAAIPGGSQSVPGTELPGVTLTVNAGYYLVTETSLTGYKQVSAVGCEGTLVNGGTATCTITNGDSKARPTAATTMSWVLHDSLTVTGYRPGATGATVTFKLYGPDDATCAGSVINGNGSGETRPVVNGRATTSTGYNLQQSQLPNKKGTYRWVAVYNGDANNNGASTQCGDETHTITVLDPAPFAVFTSPVDGATNVDTWQPITWTAVADAQAYYLYVGTSAGAKDLVDSGELQTTSYQAYGLPAGQPLYARLWTKKAGVWRYTDITFTAAIGGPVLKASVITPANGATGVVPTGVIQWNSVQNAQKYYVYVGSTPGTNDLIDSQEICNGCLNSPMVLFWNMSNAGKSPALGLGGKAGQTVYLRMWTMVGGIWRYVDSSFTLAP